VIAAIILTHYAITEALIAAIAGQVASLSVFDAWVMALLIWAGISAVLTVGFVLIVPIAAAHDQRKRSRKNAIVPDRTPPTP